MDGLVFLGRIAVALAAVVVAYVLVRRRLMGGLRLTASLPGGRGSHCPHLGLASDPFKRLEHANDEHRCYAHLSRERVDLTHQRQFCLSTTYARCPFLTVKPREEGLIEQMRAWWRSVSPAHPAPAQHGPRTALGGSHGGRGAAVGTLLAIAQRAMATSRVWLATAGVAVASQSRGAAGAGGHVSSRWAGVRDQSPSAVLRELLVIGRQTAIVVGILLLRLARWAGPRLVVLARWAVLSITKRHRSARLSARLAATPRPSAAVHQLLAAGAAPAAAATASPVAQHESVASAPSWQDVEDAMRVETIVPADPKGPGLLNRVAAHKQDLVERGIAAVEAGREAEAYAHFKRATELDPRALRAWFWRAKTAETLDEVIKCLERAKALEPSNSQIASNLSWAVQRRDAARAAAAAAAAAKKAPAERASLAIPRGPSVVYRVGRLVLSLSRAAAALAAFLVGATWLLSAMPSELRQAIGTSAVPALPLPGPGMLTSLVHLPQVAGYDVGSSIPYGIGFLGLFVGLGLLGGDTWTRLWAPLLGIGSAYIWSIGAPADLAPFVLPTCAIVAMGGVLAGDRFPRQRFRYRARRSALQSG